VVTVAALMAALAIIGASMFVLTPNAALFAVQLQPLIVAGYLAREAALNPGRKWLRELAWLFLALAALGSVRAVGMTAWGAACAADGGYRAAMERVRTELNGCPAGTAVVLSSAYLYEAARHNDLRWIHSDWMEPARRDQPDGDWTGLTALKPARVILTQFDYYRRYEPMLARLKTRPDLADIRIINTAEVPAPDSIPSLRKVLQHISWAPVVVSLSWKEAPGQQ
jgi:hypothetical protein